MNRVANSLANSCFILFFIINKSGKEYRISHLRKLKIAVRILLIHKKIKSLSTWKEHLFLVDQIFRVPKSLNGDVVECGSYSGSSTASLSLACNLTNRRLIICDSFEGLPRPGEDEKYSVMSDTEKYYHWQEGEFAVEGGLNEVKKNVERYGNIEVCKFVKGYFQDTLKTIKTDSIVLIFEDVDIASSAKDCLKYLWPKLSERCKFYCHEPWSFEVASLFFNKEWWAENLQTTPPGFFGSGNGIMWGGGKVMIGYAKKFSKEEVIQKGKKIVHLGTKDFKEPKG